MKKLILYIFCSFLFTGLYAQSPVARQDSSARPSRFTAGAFELRQNYPNPFSKSTQIDFYSTTEQTMTFKVFDMLGNVVMNKELEADKGANYYIFDRGTLAPGFYFYSLQSGSTVLTKRMMIKD